MKNLLHSIAFTTLIASAFSCGKSDDETAAATVISGSLKTTLLASTDITSYALTSAACTSDADTGLFTGTFGAAGGTSLAVKIKGFAKSSQTYTCTQPEDNRDGDVGQKYNSCAVEFSIPDPVTGVNTYDMYRDTVDKKAFTYAGSCTVSTQYTAPKLTLTINCGGMIQTLYQSAARNPIDPAITGSVNSATTAECNI